MDGRITYVDAALVMVDINLAQYGMLDHSLITEEQRALGNVNGLDNGKLLNTEVPYIEITDAETGALVTVNNYVAFPLEFEDYLAIHTVAYLRNWYGADINMQDVMNAINSDPFSIAEYQNSHETIRPNWKEAGDLCDEMGMALTFHYPLDTHELLYDEKGNLLYGDLKYTAEDFWNMARQMLVYFEDTK